MRLVLTIPPAAEPILLEEQKLFSRIDINIEDTLINYCIKSARQFVESYTQSVLINQTWTCFYDACEIPFCKRIIKLPTKPVSSITSLKTYDTDNVATTFSPSNYRLSGDRIVLNDTSEWPTEFRLYDSFEMVVVAGYGASGTDVPEDIKQAIRMLAAFYIENREAALDSIENLNNKGVIPFGVTALLQPYRTYSLA